MSDFASAGYWERRYQAGGNSGAGSYGRLADFKARFINAFVDGNRIESVIEFGCGDGNQLSLLSLPKYTGVDVSPTTLERCRQRFADKPSYNFVNYEGLANVPGADLTLSLDVIFHLVEDSIFELYMRNLFLFAKRFVLVYSSNLDRVWPEQHVRHRRFTDHVAQRHPEWKLAAFVPNAYPFDSRNPDHTSFADFYLYRRSAESCIVPVPGPTG